MLARGTGPERALILLYHRVAELDCDPWGLAVTPEHFAEHLDVLRRIAKPVSLRKLTESLAAGALPRRAVAVTFDDGYEDNFDRALPLLARAEVDATFFVATSAIDAADEFWWDELEQSVLAAPQLPREIRVRIGGQDRVWPIAESDVVVSNDVRSRSWRVWEGDITTRHRAYREIYDLLFPMPAALRRQSMDTLARACGIVPVVRSSHRTVRAAALERASRQSGLEIGAHSISHPRLSTLAEHEQAHEIRGSKLQLEEITGFEIESFAYPFGRTSDISPAAIGLVRSAGYRRACTTTREPVGTAASLHELPRIGVPDADGESFARYLHGYFDARG